MQPENTHGYLAARLDDTTLLIGLLAVRDIKNASDTVHDRDLKPINLAGSMQSLAYEQRKQILVAADKAGEFALYCDDIRVLPAARLKVLPLRPCMQGPSSLFTGMAMMEETLTFLCDADDLGALIRQLGELEHGNLASHPA